MNANTKIVYCYRDAANYKTYKEIVVTGVLNIDDLSPYMMDGEFFIPSEIGLDDLQDDPFTTDDHIWHEFDSINATNEQPTISIDSQEFIRKCKTAAEGDWNLKVVFKKKGLL